MTEPDSIGTARNQLRDAIAEFQPPPCDPLTISPWVAMSLLQKAIRRGRKDLALRAAATLLHGSPERLWRRLGCIAFEDVGVADLDTVAVVTTTLAGKRCRETLGDEWPVASYIVSRMVHATKCRASDDLLLAAENHPDFEDTRLAFAFRSVDNVISIATGTDPLPIRALAAWCAIGRGRLLHRACNRGGATRQPFSMHCRKPLSRLRWSRLHMRASARPARCSALSWHCSFLCGSNSRHQLRMMNSHQR
jgi:hypothetical protein